MAEKDTKIYINDLSTKSTYVDLTCRVLSINAKEYDKNGERATRYYGLLEDKTGKKEIIGSK